MLSKRGNDAVIAVAKRLMNCLGESKNGAFSVAELSVCRIVLIPNYFSLHNLKIGLAEIPFTRNLHNLLNQRSLPDKDSNLDNQIQRLMYYHYTIGQSGKKPELGSGLLACKDSNLDKQDQNLSYYHYTTGQSCKWSAKIRSVGKMAKSVWLIVPAV